jgi:hypothetical protein
MLKLYIFWGTFVLVLAGVCVTLLRQRSARKKTRTDTGSPTPVAPPRDDAGDSAAAVPFDPSATRIYARAAATGSHAILPSRDEASLHGSGSAKLVCLGGAQKGKSFAVTVAGLNVGRSADSDIVLSDPRVSSQHAWIGIIDTKVVLRDMQSTNGTFLNAQLDAPVSEIALRPGDTIFFGGHGGDQFRFVVD